MSAMQIIGGLMLAVPAGLALHHGYKCGALRETFSVIGLSAVGGAWLTGAIIMIAGYVP